MCEHKAVFPILPLEIEGTFVMIVLLTLAVLSGVGGGGIVVPMLMSYFMIGMKDLVRVLFMYFDRKKFNILSI